MTGRKPKKTGLALTELELEVMNYIWDSGETTVREVCDLINEKKALAYTTVATMFKSLENKKYLISKKNGNVLVFTPDISRAKFQDWYCGNRLSQIFTSPQSLVSQFIEDTNLSKKEIAKVKKALENLEF
jgi:predicted transcriptional regulator